VRGQKVKNNIPLGKIVFKKSLNAYRGANVMPGIPKRDYGFSFAGLSAANEKLKFSALSAALW
jgi:hypothetical protein